MNNTQRKNLNKTARSLVQRTLNTDLNSDSIKKAAAMHPEISSMVQLLRDQRNNILAAQSTGAKPVTVAQDTDGAMIPVSRMSQSSMSFGERAVSMSFPATTTEKIFVDQYGVCAASTGRTNANATITAGTFSTSTATVLAAISSGNAYHLKKIICTKADSNFSAVTCRAISGSIDGGLNQVNLNFSKGLSPQNFNTTVLDFPLDMIVDGFFALSVNTGAATDFTVTLIMDEQQKSYDFQSI